MKKKLIWMFPILWMVIIFDFSSQDGNESTQTSLRVGRLIGSVICQDYEEMTAQQQTEYARGIELIVRKEAHSMEYAILCIAFLVAFSQKKVYAYPMTVLYAMSDEFHQLFVPGREGKLTDVLIDSGGALFGLLLFILIRNITKKR